MATNWMIILVVAVILVTLDKGITALNILAVEKNQPTVNAFAIEKNPIAKASYEKFGLWGGTIIYWLFSIITFLFATWLLHFPMKMFTPANTYGTALYVMCIAYGFVVANNFYFWFRFNGWLGGLE
jgi:hypothetical protein